MKKSGCWNPGRERSGRLYVRLGAGFFKKMIRRGLFAIFDPALHLPANKTMPALRNLESEMGKAETSHLAIFSAAGYALLLVWWDAAA